MRTLAAIASLALLSTGLVGHSQAQDTSPIGMKDWDVPTGERWWSWSGADAYTEGFEGAITGDPNSYWFTPTTLPPERIRSVEVRFTSVHEQEGEDQYKPADLENPNVSWAYRYLRNAGGAVPQALTSTSSPWDWSKYIVNTEGPGSYVYQDRSPICLSAWDVSSDPHQRLEVAFLENNVSGGLVNGAYGPPLQMSVDNIATDGPREWLLIFDLDYTDPSQGQNSDILTRNGLLPDVSAGEEDLPFMWVVYATRRRETRFPQDGDTFLMISHTSPPYVPTEPPTSVGFGSWGEAKGSAQ